MNLPPEQLAIRRRVLNLRRKQRPMSSKGDKHAWVSEFMALYELKAWEVMGESRRHYIGQFGLSESRVYEFRTYLRIFELAVNAGVNPWLLRFVPVSVVYACRKYRRHPNVLVRELAGSKAAEERKRKVFNRGQRNRYHARKARRAAAQPESEPPAR